MARLLWRLFLCVLLGAVIDTPSVVGANSLQQAATATLQFANQGGQSITFCPFVVLQEPFTIILNSTQHTLAPHASETIAAPAGWYVIVVDDCAGSPLFEHSDLHITDSYTIRLGNAGTPTAPAPTNRTRLDCLALNLDGERLYRRGELDQALQAFTAALVCIEEIGLVSAETDILNNLGRVYLDQGRYDDALANLEQALTIERDLGHRQNEGTLLSTIGAVYHDLGRHRDALANYQLALAIAEAVGDRGLAGTALNNMGTVYNDLGDYAAALTRLEQALVIKRDLGDQKGEAQTLNNIAKVYDSQGRLTAALDYYQQALDRQLALGAQWEVGIIFNNIAGVYNAQGRYREAVTTFQKSLTLARELGDRAGEGIILNNLGAVYNAQGNLAAAIATYQQAIGIMQAIGDRASEGVILNNIGDVYRNQLRFTDALATYQRSIAIAQAVDDRVGEGITLNNIALVYEKQERYAEALTNLQQARSIMREAGGRRYEAIALSNISRVYGQQKRYREALTNAQQALRLHRAIGDRASEGVTLYNIGLIYENQENYPQALASYEQALPIVRAVGDRRNEGLILNNMGGVYYKQGDTGNALASYQAGIAVLELVRVNAGNYQARTSFAESFADAYTHMIELNVKTNPALAFWYSERGRARAFLDSLRTGDAQVSDQEALALLAQEQEHYTARQFAQDRLNTARAANPPDPAWIQEAEVALAEAEATYDQAVRAITTRSDQLADLIPTLQNVLHLTETQALLPADTTLLAYWMLADKTLAFVITAQDIETVELPGVTASSILSATESLYRWRNLDNPHPQPLRQLYQALIAPVIGKLNTDQLAIIPHQALHYVPFAALVDESRKQYLGEQYTLSILPSANVLPYLQANAQAAQARSTHHAVIFGNPMSNEEGLPPLLYAQAEANAVATILNTRAFTATAASETTLWQTARGAPIVHLAAHGAYSQANALNSAIYLAPAPPLTSTIAAPMVDTTLDGRLETHEIFELPLAGNDLVVLSACQSNVGALSRGDEIIGLTRAFFFAGAPTVISSLWNVDDNATGTLMTAFYRHWKDEGMSKAEALQSAQAEVRSNPRWASPFYWAGFVLNGHFGRSNSE